MHKWFTFILLAGLLLAACASGKTASPATQTVGAEVVSVTQTALPSQTLSPTLPPAVTVTPTRDLQATSGDTESMAGCTAKSLFPTPDPTLAALFPAVSETDWSRGPETASVTLIEYSDFQ